MFVPIQELLPLMEIGQRELLAKQFYDELVMGILRVLSRLDLSVTTESTQQKVAGNVYVIIQSYRTCVITPGQLSLAIPPWVGTMYTSASPQHDALAPYPWSCSVNWCLAEV